MEKYGANGYVSRSLDLNSIVFSQKPDKNELYLLNTFSLKKNNEECLAMNTRYCSRGAHLGLSTFILMIRCKWKRRYGVDLLYYD